MEHHTYYTFRNDSGNLNVFFYGCWFYGTYFMDVTFMAVAFNMDVAFIDVPSIGEPAGDYYRCCFEGLCFYGC